MSYATPLPLRVSPKYTRMHSNRMPTERAFTVCRSLLLGGGGTWSLGWGGGVPAWSRGGVYPPDPGAGGCTWSGGVWSRGVYLPGPRGGVPAWSWGGCTWSEGVVPGGYLIRGGTCLVWGGVYLVRYSPPWTEFLTHASENITLPETSFAGGKNPVLNEYVSEGQRPTIQETQQACASTYFSVEHCITFPDKILFYLKEIYLDLFGDR